MEFFGTNLVEFGQVWPSSDKYSIWILDFLKKPLRKEEGKKIKVVRNLSSLDMFGHVWLN